MPELIPGKRYRLTAEGTADANGIFYLNGVSVWIHPFQQEMMTFELLPDPLPTTPGSVIRHRGDLLMRHGQNATSEWISAEGDFVEDSEVEGATVLFDAGAERD